MGNFEKLSVLVIVVIIVMILVVALYTWTDSPADATATAAGPSMADAGLQAIIDPLPAPVQPRPEPPRSDQPSLVAVPAPLPVPPAPPAPEAKPTVREYVIASGDTLEKISKAHYDSTRHIGALEKANPGLDPVRLRVGQKIVIPDVKGIETKPLATDGLDRIAKGSGGASPGEVYTVRRGDSLPEIARRAYGKIDRWHEIWLANYERIDDPDRLPSGTRLSLPR